jgi:hypothetical protein
MSHGFRNPFKDQATMLIIFADGNRPTEDELLTLMSKYDQFEVDVDGTVPGWGRH